MVASAKHPAAVRDYDEFLDWDRRLAKEGPFFSVLFGEEGTKDVIDVGCGSARHAIMFAGWGLSVTGVDPDDTMLAQARENLERFADDIRAGGGSLRIVKGGFGELEGLALSPADAVVCTGNALPHVNGREGLAEALADFAAVLRPGGIVVLHLLNHARLLTRRVRAIPPKVVNTSYGTTKVFVRVIDYPEGDAFLDFDFVTLERDAEGTWGLTNRRSAHTALPVELLAEALEVAGFECVQVFGGHDRHELTDADESVIVVAHRR